MAQSVQAQTSESVSNTPPSNTTTALPPASDAAASTPQTALTPASEASAAVPASSPSPASGIATSPYALSVALQPGGRVAIEQPLQVQVLSVPANDNEPTRTEKLIALYIAPAVALIVGGIAAVLSWRNWKTARVNVLIKCHETYGDIYLDLFRLAEGERPPAIIQWTPQKRIEAKVSFIRLWNLQYEEFVYFKQGTIPEEVFENWMMYRYKDYRHPDFDRLPVNYAKTWDERKREFGPTSEFVEFMRRAMEQTPATLPATATPEEQAKAAVADAMAWYLARQNWCVRFRRWCARCLKPVCGGRVR
jgi:hypothetical protein